NDIRGALTALPPNATVRLSVIRTQMKDLQITMTLGRRPLDMMNEQDEVKLKEQFAAWWREQGGDLTTTSLVAKNTDPYPQPWSNTLPTMFITTESTLLP